MPVVLATTNLHKVKEILKIWGEVPFEILTLSSFPEIAPIDENGTTFTENALIKARVVAQETGLIAIADDSGLEVDVLQKRPGVYSARYALLSNNVIPVRQGGGIPQVHAGDPRLLGDDNLDHQNLQKVLDDLRAIQADFNQCTARFRCVAALVDPSGREMTTEGTIEGVICETPRGKNGFGYDPIFLIPSENRTLAEMSAEEKNKISHRAEAFREMKNKLRNLGYF